MRGSHGSKGMAGAAAVLAAALLMLATETASAALINSRPVVLDVSGGNGELDLQTVLDGHGLGSIDVQTDQIPNAVFASLGAGVEVGSTFVIELAGYAPDNEFGIYSSNGDDAFDPVLASVFSGADGAGDISEIISISNGDLLVGGQLYAGFGDSFGFFIRNDHQGFTYFSEDSRNGAGAQALIFGGIAPGEIVVAFEDVYLPSSDHDFNDLVVTVKGVRTVQPIPEPAPAILFGIGVLLVATIVRRRMTR